jgi:apolipoprotein D and lipocalin family protein
MKRKFKISRIFLITAMIALLLTMALACEKTMPTDDHTVTSVDLKRYVGKWYEIASLPAPFQEGCFCTTAEYSLEKDHVKVVNRCRRGSPQGEVDEALGKAWPVEGSNNSRLKVSFFWPFKGDYWIIGLDQDYQWAMVGHPQKKYLWILSRSPNMPMELYQSLVSKAKSMGYDVARLKLMNQACYR